MAENPEDEKKAGRGYGTGYAIVGAGFQLVFSMLFFMGMGYLADRAVGTEPWLMLVGLAVGLAAGFYAFWLRISAEAGKPGR
jgi:F0F1-type ATP synthase assembly protein I